MLKSQTIKLCAQHRRDSDNHVDHSGCDLIVIELSSAWQKKGSCREDCHVNSLDDKQYTYNNYNKISRAHDILVCVGSSKLYTMYMKPPTQVNSPLQVLLSSQCQHQYLSILQHLHLQQEHHHWNSCPPVSLYMCMHPPTWLFVLGLLILLWTCSVVQWYTLHWQ